MNIKLLTVPGLALVLGACVSAPRPNAALAAASAQVSAAEADPDVAKYDPLDLQAAQQDLQAAQTAANRGKEDQVAQPAYMATQTARLAEARAATKADQARVAQGTRERDRIELAARARETNVALAQRNEAAAQAAQLQAQVAELKAKETNRGLVLTLGDVLFDTGKASLNPGAALNLDRLATFLQQHPERRVEIDGFTDSVGPDAYNQELSEERAESVKAALVARGIDPSRVTTEGYGKSFPVASNNDSAGRQLNRRVEVVIGNGNGPIAPRSSAGS
ncbi:MAG TPA: OmpA family protein [Steroidobacteraceae bacterium]|nr:OmpA family protein [Steroidobacteraceae bacterium]